MFRYSTEEELIKAYLNYYHERWSSSRETKLNADPSPWNIVDSMRSPEDLDFVFKLLKACQDDGEIAYVAAGPLKDIFSVHHSIIKEKLSVMVRQHDFMRKAVQALILSPDSNSPERKTLEEILKKYGLRYASF